ncbi:MAG: Serine/threonine-protein kinase PknB [Verrucomicrobia bacterium ADurb.Bin122]|nr:MAG: Serine/threonine-protein kinase PknB [Verrucomicrobia bacterium ADurb.Bin122]
MDDLDYGQTLAGFRSGQTVFSRYALTRMLGRGGMGVVWLARDGKLEQDVALKFLPELVAHDASALGDLKRETRRSLQLTHPHIVRIYDFVEDNRSAAVSMEFVDGASLTERRMQQPGQVFSATQLRPWVEQLCAALHYAHEKAKIAHRDLKPANLMVDARGDLKVADFGISATLADTTTRASKQVTSSGTPVYMSPQQMMGEKPAPTDDIYSLGATLYEMLTGKPPFYTGNILLQVQNKVPPSMAERREELEVKSADPIPLEWEQTIAACLAKEAAERPQSASEVWGRLNGDAGMVNREIGRKKAEAVVSRVPVAPHGKALVHAAPAARAGSRKLWAGWLATGALMVAGVAWLYFGVQVPQERREAELARRMAVAQDEVARTERAARQRADEERRLAQEAVAREQAAKAAAEQELAAAKKRAALEAEQKILSVNATGGLRIRTTPAGAEVRVEMMVVGKAPLSVQELKAGPHLVHMRMPGYEDWDGEVVVQKNHVEDLSVDLVRSQGTLELASEPAGLDVEVRCQKPESGEAGNDVRIVQTPARVNLPTGDYAITFRRSGSADQVRSVTIGRKDVVSAKATFDDTTAQIVSAGPVERAQTPVVRPESGHRWVVPEIDLQMVPIASGEFVMGTHLFVLKKVAALGLRDRTQMRVRLTQPYWMGQYEVTQAQWVAIMGYNPSYFKNTGQDLPVESVSYREALDFCRKLTARERAAGRLPDGYAYTLPTEAQWEYACRAGQSEPPDTRLGTVGWYSKNSDKTTHPVGQKQPNGWGLYDMQGNVWEWCWDWLADFPASSAVDPSGPLVGGGRCVRGGSWNRKDDYCTVSFRGKYVPGAQDKAVGFRLVLAPILEAIHQY